MALAADLLRADCGRHAGGGGLYYPASHRQPDGKPGSIRISSGAAFGVVLMLFLVPGNAFGWLMPAGSIGAAVTLMIILIASGRGGFASPHAAGRDGAEHRVYHAADDVAGERRSAHGRS